MCISRTMVVVFSNIAIHKYKYRRNLRKECHKEFGNTLIIILSD